jgi:hypothetical protein
LQDTNTTGAPTKRQSERITQAKNNSKKDESTNGESLKFLVHTFFERDTKCNRGETQPVLLAKNSNF